MILYGRKKVSPAKIKLCMREDGKITPWEQKLICGNYRVKIPTGIPAYLEMGPWYQECFSRELTGVT